MIRMFLVILKIDYAEMKQDEFNAKLTDLSNYTPKVQKSIQAKKNLDNAKSFYKGREKIIDGFKNEILLLNHDDEFEEQRTSKKFNVK